MPAEVAAVIVTYNNEDDVEQLLRSLRDQARETALRVIVADNSSIDATVSLLASHDDVTVIRSGGNLGYAGGINTALAHVPGNEHVLVINPDLTLDPGAVRTLLRRLELSEAGVVAPAIRDLDGRLYHSLRREPTVLRALGDAAFGSRFAGRPAILSDIDGDPARYGYAHPVDWASGAALLIRAEVVDQVGAWDERYFLYSEETDFEHRVRRAGHEIWFEPDAVIRHEQGGSGASAQLTALMAVNRVRYVEHYHGAVYAAAFRAAVLLHELLRIAKPGHAEALRAVADRRSWSSLPRASLSSPGPVGGSIIIPAHNEESVIGRTLESLLPLLSGPDEVEVIVVCNATTDATPDIARGFTGVQVVELDEASKVAALNLGDQLATRWPRLYLDADIEISPDAVRSLFAALTDPTPDGMVRLEAARPTAHYDGADGTALVRSYYRARSRMADLDKSLWGAGAYAVNQVGHDRFPEFPRMTADDLFIDRLFPAERKAVIPTEPVVVRLPRDAANLGRILRRGVRANAEHPEGTTTSRTAAALIRSIRGPFSAFDAAVYAGFVVLARLQTRLGATSRPAWERDASTR
ncbi:MAG: glycosyltransferase family 2 protein [Propionibacteriaceae bacterium]|nr:glycosyltransferase family 2 protein [Propionibacteriaceae bacterium]